MFDRNAGSKRSPLLGGSRRARDPQLWGALLGRDDRRREQAARTIYASVEQARWYAREILDALPSLQVWQRFHAGDALSLLGDIRFSRPHFLPEMLVVPSGIAILGSPDYPSEYPVHSIDVGSFALSQYPITNIAYRTFVEATGRKPPQHWGRGKPHPARLNAPVVHVSARDAEAYCVWLSNQTGHDYRLPTEAEWMLAARGGGDQRVYPWGDDFDKVCANCWTDGPVGRVAAVGMFPEGNGTYGHGDLAGNVWEWNSSLYWPYPYRADDGREDPGTDEEPRVIHGGGWRSRSASLRCSARQGELPTDSFDFVGFRVARSQTHV
jgi:formylglycine-generating enzyme required for sulfatase activity